MKKLCFSLFASIGFLFATAQTPADTLETEPLPVHDYRLDTMHLNNIQLWQFGYIAILAGDNSPETSAYLKRVAEKWDGIDSNQTIKVVTRYGQFVDTYERLLTRSDGMAADFNIDLLLKVFPDAKKHPWVMKRIDEMRKHYEYLRQKAKEEGIKLMEAYKRASQLDSY